jgi:hypothetical protein
MSLFDFLIRRSAGRPEPLPACNDDGGLALSELENCHSDQLRRWEAAMAHPRPASHTAPGHIDISNSARPVPYARPTGLTLPNK